MSNEFETPEEREAKINEANARINEAIAQDVASGMADKAQRERNRANMYAAGNTHLNRELDSTRFQRDIAERDAAIARNDARNGAFGFWLLAGVIAIGLFFGTLLWANHNNDTTVASAGSNSLPPAVVTHTVTVTPAPAPTAAPAPTVVREYVPIPVPVHVAPAPTPAPEPNPLRGYVDRTSRMVPKTTPQPVPTVTPDATQQPTNSDEPLHGYVEH